MTRELAISILERYSNQYKRTYVRVDNRQPTHDVIDGTNYALDTVVRVYSKTWSKRRAYIVDKATGKWVADMPKAKKLIEAAK